MLANAKRIPHQIDTSRTCLVRIILMSCGSEQEAAAKLPI